MERLWQDVRYSIRVMFKNPAFTAVAVVVLGLGIGANTAIFTLVNAFLLRPIVAKDPEQLISLFNRNTRNPGYRAFSYPDYVDLRDRNTVFSNLLAHDETMVGITEGETTRRVFADLVSANFFATFGANMTMGRGFTPEEEKPGAAAAVVVLSHEYWKKNGSDPDVLGKTVRLNGQIFTVVGITPQEFTGTMVMLAPSVYLPLGTYDRVTSDLFQESGRRKLDNRKKSCLFLVGRLKPGVTAARADSELAVLAAQLAKAYPAENRDYTIHVHRMARLSTSTNPQDDSELTSVSAALSFMAAVVLLIACLNLANMLLARGTARRKEFAIRLALGGGRRRLMRQLLTEGVLLSAMGGVAGALLAYGGARVLVSSMTTLLPLEMVFHSGPDVRVMVAMIGFSMLSTVLFGLGPALKLSRPDVVADLKENAAEDTGGRHHRLFARRNLLVMGQLSLSLVLLVTAGLTIRGALKAARTDPGFSLEGGVVIELDPSLAGYAETRARDAYRRLAERLRAVPGVEAVSVAATVPFGNVSLGREVRRAGEPDAPGDPVAAGRAVSARFNAVGADYFDALGLHLLRGRPFSPGEADSGSTPPVAIVDELLANKLWPGQNALGKWIQYGGAKPGEPVKPIEIVGIAPPIRHSLFDHTPPPQVYAPFGQSYNSNANLHLRIAPRGRIAETALLNQVRREIRNVDDRLPVLAFKTLRSHFDESFELWIVRTGARLFTTFGLLALLLALVGVYGVTAYTVARRTREIGIRIALGATTGDALWLILREGICLTATSVTLGVLLALGTARFLGSVLYEVSSTDPLIFVTAPVLLAGVSLLACYLPAWRAARVDPMVALRCE